MKIYKGRKFYRHTSLQRSTANSACIFEYQYKGNNNRTVLLVPICLIFASLKDQLLMIKSALSNIHISL